MLCHLITREQLDRFQSNLKVKVQPRPPRLFYVTVIPRFTSFRLYEMHKLIPVFQFTSQFSLIRAPSSRKPIIVPGASSREVMGN
jgi:hypothetical protein